MTEENIMTEEQKHSNEAAAFAASLGALEGSIKKVDRWEARAEEQNERQKLDFESATAARDAQRRDHESAIANRETETARAERYEEEHRREWRENAERHAVYLAEVRHVQAHREREVAAVERIADAPEKLGGKLP